jgi:hypothetical protein
MMIPRQRFIAPESHGGKDLQTDWWSAVHAVFLTLGLRNGNRPTASVKYRGVQSWNRLQPQQQRKRCSCWTADALSRGRSDRLNIGQEVNLPNCPPTLIGGENSH